LGKEEMNIFSRFFGKKEDPSEESVRKISIRGPLESVSGKLMLQIPLAAGGKDLALAAGSIGHIEGEFLKVEILPWLAEKLEIQKGSIVVIDNLEGKFRITRTDETEPNQAPEPTAPSGRGSS
jgi:hypothetical protein